MLIALRAALLFAALATSSHGVTYRGEQLRSPCLDLLAGKTAPEYPVVDLRNRQESTVADLKDMTHSQMLLVTRRAFMDRNMRTALHDSPALLCLKMDTKSALALSKSLHRKDPVFFAIPNDSDGINHLYRHGSDMNSLEPIIQQMKRIVTQLDPIKDRITFLSDSRSERKQGDQVAEAFRSTTVSGIITLVCHNDRGTIKFPDGSRITLSEIGQLAKSQKKTALILSCNTIDHIDAEFDGLVSTKALDFEDIATGLVEADTLFRKGGFECTYLGDFLYALDTGMKESGKRNRRLGVTIKTIGGLVVVVGVAVIFDDDDDKKPPQQ